ncbi:MAG: hypothetical protein MJZ35_03795 [Bacteroidaceae bacterium]|nr:hypothetical protein [Bacteroidaceae bacterium]
MKKQYTKPQVKVFKIDTTVLICTSPGVGFGDGDTDFMNAKRFDNLFLEEDDHWEL